MINIVIPMAGLGSRFSKAGFKLPKPLIDVQGKHMIELIIENLTPLEKHRFIFICQKSHEKYNLSEILRKKTNNCEIIFTNEITDGALCTVLLGKEFITDDSLMIANCDQYIDFDINIYLNKFHATNSDGFIMTMISQEDKWSYIDLKNDLVSRVVEKKVISEFATVGIYNFKNGNEFKLAAFEMINKNERVNNEFYVAPVYNSLIENNMKIRHYNIGKPGSGMFGLGTPEDLKIFNQQVSLK